MTGRYTFSFILSCAFYFCAHAQERKNLNIGVNSNYAGFDGINEQVASSRIIISGENGAYSAFTSRFEFKFLRYLNEEHGLRNYVMEVGPAKARLINDYISTGDSSVEILLRSVSSTKYMRLYKNVKKLNEKLADSLKIRVFGIDIEKYSALPIVQISNILPKGDIPERIRIGVEALHGAARYVIKKGLDDLNNEKEGQDVEDNYFFNPTNFSVFKSSEEFLIYYDSLKAEFQKWSDTDFAELEEAVSWLRENKDWRDHRYSAYQYSIREQNLYANFKKVLDEHTGEKFFAQMNRCRISRLKLYGDCGYYDYSGTVQRLSQSADSANYRHFTLAIFHAAAGDLDTDNSANVEAISRELQPIFAGMDDESAQLLTFGSGAEFPVLRANYDAIVVEKNYPVRDFGETENDLMPMFSPGSVKRFHSAPPFLAINYLYTYHFFNTRHFSSALSNENLPEVEPNAYFGVDATAYLGSEAYLGFNYSWSGSPSMNFVSQRYLGNFGAQMYGNEHYYLGGGLQLGSIRHNYSRPASQNADSSYYRYNEPTVISNPAFVMGFNYLMQVKLWYFSFYVTGGYMVDLSEKRWILKGEYVSDIGKFSNSGFYVSGGVGLALPLVKKESYSIPGLTK